MIATVALRLDDDSDTHISTSDACALSLSSRGASTRPIDEQVFRLNSAIEPATVRATVFIPALLEVEYEADLVRFAADIPAGVVCVVSMMRIWR